ncbi:efflux RND transporter periplasmic adaptor subunit [Rhizorhapis sp. SPR117]|uniref:efflux RND transporter periplasmic adaptor subunit n=1 Tax=Rhizorhapis sp. SPR117 TaxID=2912611 RepID=UPI001EFFED95|nr:efflux RND transporter periplasmic adaptor subunit [Rhizorhapis sp. SPR117]
MRRLKLGGLLLMLALAACGGGQDTETDQAQRVAGERLVVRPSEITEYKDVGAEITTEKQADARARIPGILISLNVRDGDMVRKGQHIGTVSDTRLGYESSAYGAQAAAAAAQAAQAKAELDRTRFLYDNGVYAKARLDQAKAAADAAAAQVAAAKAQQSAVQAVAGQGAIYAPASGRVLHADIPVGSAVAPGMSIASITAGQPVLRIEVPESLAGALNRGASVIATGLNPADQENAPRGTVTRVYPAVSAGRMQADVTVPGLDARFIGRKVTVLLEIGKRKAIAVPRRFITTRFGVDYALLAVGNGQATEVPVQVAPLPEGGKVEILSGVSAGDTLIATKAGK